MTRSSLLGFFSLFLPLFPWHQTRCCYGCVAELQRLPTGSSCTLVPTHPPDTLPSGSPFARAKLRSVVSVAWAIYAWPGSALWERAYDCLWALCVLCACVAAVCPPPVCLLDNRPLVVATTETRGIGARMSFTERVADAKMHTRARTRTCTHTHAHWCCNVDLVLELTPVHLAMSKEKSCKWKKSVSVKHSYNAIMQRHDNKQHIWGLNIAPLAD